MELGEPTSYVSFRGEHLLRLGEVLRMAGKTDDASDAFRRATGLFDKKENLVLAARARDELASLGSE